MRLLKFFLIVFIQFSIIIILHSQTSSEDIDQMAKSSLYTVSRIYSPLSDPAPIRYQNYLRNNYEGRYIHTSFSSNYGKYDNESDLFNDFNYINGGKAEIELNKLGKGPIQFSFFADISGATGIGADEPAGDFTRGFSIGSTYGDSESSTYKDYNLETVLTLYKKVQLGIEYQETSFSIIDFTDASKTIPLGGTYYKYSFDILDINFDRLFGKYRNNSPSFKKVNIYNKIGFSGNRFTEYNFLLGTGLLSIPLLSVDYHEIPDLWLISPYIKLRIPGFPIWTRTTFMNEQPYFSSIDITIDMLPLFFGPFLSSPKVISEGLEQGFLRFHESNHSGFLMYAGPGVTYTHQDVISVEDDYVISELWSPYFRSSYSIRVNKLFAMGGDFYLGWNDPVKNGLPLMAEYSEDKLFHNFGFRYLQTFTWYF